MATALMIGLFVVLGNLAVLMFFRGSALRRAECPRCLGRDTYAVNNNLTICCDCELRFGIARPRPHMAA
jgi:hypothetical protein